MSSFATRFARRSAFMMVNAPKTFQLGNVVHIKERLYNAVKAWRGCDLIWRVRCQMESIRMARVSGLSKEDGVSAGEVRTGLKSEATILPYDSSFVTRFACRAANFASVSHAMSTSHLRLASLVARHPSPRSGPHQGDPPWNAALAEDSSNSARGWNAFHHELRIPTRSGHRC